jgi:hypothetical protein
MDEYTEGPRVGSPPRTPDDLQVRCGLHAVGFFKTALMNVKLYLRQYVTAKISPYRAHGAVWKA